MWTRKEIKAKGKKSFKKNYWKAIVVGLLLSAVAGGTSCAIPTGGGNPGQMIETMKEADKDNPGHLVMEVDEAPNGQKSVTFDVKDENGNSIEDTDDSGNTSSEIENVEMSKGETLALGVAVAVSFFVIFMICFAIGMSINALLINPIEMGCSRFFLKNLNEEAGISNVSYAFDHNYKKIVKVLFRRDISIFLWSLLFVIPGIYKTYEYRMIPYLLSDNSEMTWKEAAEASKTMMQGNKWRAFVLDLSFIGWNILSIFTLGILSIFFVNPYKFSTNAALYEALKYGDLDTDTAETVSAYV